MPAFARRDDAGVERAVVDLLLAEAGDRADTEVLGLGEHPRVLRVRHRRRGLPRADREVVALADDGVDRLPPALEDAVPGAEREGALRFVPLTGFGVEHLDVGADAGLEGLEPLDRGRRSRGARDDEDAPFRLHDTRHLSPLELAELVVGHADRADREAGVPLAEVGLGERIPGIQQHEARPALQVLEDELHARDGRGLRDHRIQRHGRLAEALSYDPVLADAGTEDHLDVDSEGLASGLGRLPLEVLVEVDRTALVGAE